VPFTAHWLDADARGVREADLGHAHFFGQELDELLGLGRFGFVFDTGVDVFRVLAEDHHVGLFRLFHRRRNTFEVLHRAQANVQVEFLAQRHVQRTDAAAHRRGQRAFDGHHVLAQRGQRFFGQPHVRAIDLGGFLAGVHLHPVDFFPSAIGLGHRSVHHLEHHRRDVEPGAITLDVRHDGLVWHVERHVGVDGDLLAFLGYLNVLVHGIVSPVEEAG
jgi:hypothetical protein